jgi:hypothetical protein
VRIKKYNAMKFITDVFENNRVHGRGTILIRGSIVFTIIKNSIFARLNFDVERI